MYQVSAKSVQWEPNCFMRRDRQTDRQTGMTKLTVAFRYFVDAPKNEPLGKIFEMFSVVTLRGYAGQ